jgi:type II secretory pathway pseudopilin PulG
MIKLFRKIRQRLLTENNFSKYLIYAIGEIVLVVIGILIALQINNWNENSKRLKQEQEILNNLKQDFDYNRKELLSVLNSNTENIKSAITVLNKTGNRYSEDFDLNLILGDVTSSVYYYPKNGFLNDLINSGNLGIIKSNELRNRLSSWMPRLDDLNLRQQATKEFENLMIRYVIDNGSWLAADESEDDQTVKSLNFPTSGFQIDNNDLLKDIKFENMVENQAVFIELINERLRLCLELNEEILELLNIEIKE